MERFHIFMKKRFRKISHKICKNSRFLQFSKFWKNFQQNLRKFLFLSKSFLSFYRRIKEFLTFFNRFQECTGFEKNGNFYISWRKSPLLWKDFNNWQHNRENARLYRKLLLIYNKIWEIPHFLQSTWRIYNKWRK